jgi:hypothetical protein
MDSSKIQALGWKRSRSSAEAMRDALKGMLSHIQSGRIR